MAETREVEVAAGIIWSGPQLLLCQRPSGHPMAGFWEFPGGKLERGETPEEALRRELWEELGLVVGDTAPLLAHTHFYPKEQLKVHLHFLTVGEVTCDPTPREGQALRWCRPADALALPVLEADIPVLALLASTAP